MPFQISSKITHKTLLTNIVWANQRSVLDGSKENEIAFFDKSGLLTGVPEYKIEPLPTNDLDLPFKVSLDGAMSMTGYADVGQDLSVGKDAMIQEDLDVGGSINTNDNFQVEGAPVLTKTGLGPTVVDSYLEFTTSPSFQVGNGVFKFVPLAQDPLTRIQIGRVPSSSQGTGVVLFDIPFTDDTPTPRVFVQPSPDAILANISLISMNVYDVTTNSFRYVKFALTQAITFAVIINGNADPGNVLLNQAFDYLAIGF